ncbi:hypothetical protein HY479_00320 [Candidatus Uhrbacteria bacterium]|nr:hypothetical protein [Candidatus Uhrbacteria bacterium]
MNRVCGLFAAVLVGVFMWSGDARAAEPLTLHLDEGFLGRPVSLSLFDSTLTIRWSAAGLRSPVDLTVRPDVSGTTTVYDVRWSDQEAIGDGVAITMAACASDAWTACEILQESPDGWTPLTNGKIRGNARIRLGITRSDFMRRGLASWYRYKNCRCAASPDFPKGSRVRVTSVRSGKTTVVRINDWGPERDKHPERAIDLDAAVFAEFAPLGAGVIAVTVEPVAPGEPGYGEADRPVKPVPKSARKKTAKQPS